MHHLIGHRTFAALEARNTEEEEHRHEAALRLEFTILVPSAGRLCVSELILQRHHTDQGCKLEYYLVLPPQITLDLEGRGDPDTPNETDLRAFEQDVANVTAECTSVKTRLVLAQSPALGHRELQQESQATLDLKRLRGLFSRRKKTVVLPTPTGDLPIELPPAPAKLPTAVECGVQALVEKMLPDEVALLRAIAWVASEAVSSDPSVKFPDRALASRTNLPDAQVLRLVSGMDAHVPARLRVSFQFDWASGNVESMKILEVLA